MTPFAVNIDREATPLVRVLASTLRLALQRLETHKVLSRLDGTFTVKSMKGTQAATYTFEKDRVTIKAGTSRKAKVIIEADLDDTSIKPNITGLYRHPFASIYFGKLLSLSLPSWADNAKRFWTVTLGLPNMPEKLIITATDESRSLSFGEGVNSAEIIGKASQLGPLLAGQSILVDDVMRGKLQFRGSLKYLTGISHAGQKFLVGDLDGYP